MSSRPATIRSAVVLPHPDGPDEHHELAVLDLEVDPVHGPRAVRIDLAHLVEGDACQGNSSYGTAMNATPGQTLLSKPAARAIASRN